MTRRLALTIVGVVIATLLLAGAGTLGLAAVRARATTVNDLRERATEIAANIDDILEVDTATTSIEATRQLRNRLRVLNTLRSLMPVDEITVLIAKPDGTLPSDGLPAGLTIDQLQPERLAAGETIADNSGKLAYAAAPATGPNSEANGIATAYRHPGPDLELDDSRAVAAFAALACAELLHKGVGAQA